jgi:hypothetical protein
MAVSATGVNMGMKLSMAAGMAAAFPTIVPSRVLGREGRSPPSDKINLGVIGDWPAPAPTCSPRCSACPMSAASRSRMFKRASAEAGKSLVDKLSGNSDCVLYRDMREMLQRKDIDAVIVATGDRWHTPASILAAEAGEDVYCEKPCGLSIKNVQDLAATMKKTDRIFQAGTQRRSVPQFQTAVEMAPNGETREAANPVRLGLPTRARQRLAAGQADSAGRYLRLEPVAGTAPWRPYCARRTSRASGAGRYDFESGARLLDWALTRSTCANGPNSGRRHDACRIRSGSDRHHVPVRERREAGARFSEDAVR